MMILNRLLEKLVLQNCFCHLAAISCIHVYLLLFGCKYFSNHSLIINYVQGSTQKHGR